MTVLIRIMNACSRVLSDFHHVLVYLFIPLGCGLAALGFVSLSTMHRDYERAMSSLHYVSPDISMSDKGLQSSDFAKLEALGIFLMVPLCVTLVAYIAYAVTCRLTREPV